MSFVRCFLLLAILISLAQISFAQTSDWVVVEQLAGQRVKVETATGKSYVGTVQSAADDAIRMSNNHSIQKKDVRRVLLSSPGHHGRNALVGLGLGAGVGLALGATCRKEDTISRGACMGGGALFFGAVGAGIGALIPSRRRWHEVYRSR